MTFKQQAVQSDLNQFTKESLKKSFGNIRWVFKGKVCNVIGTIIEAILPQSQLGTIVNIEAPSRNEKIIAEVVGFKQDRVLLLPYTHLEGVSPGCPISIISNFTRIKVGDFLLGKIVDPFLNSLQDEPIPIPKNAAYGSIDTPAPNPLQRQRIKKSLSLGIKAIDTFLTFGEGQRIGIMAGSGVGKSVLMGMIARNSEADINVIALIGERGREVREFIEKDLGEEGLKSSVIISVTSDQSPLMRIRGAKVATAICEYFSSQGKNVLLILDSLTRVAMAQREIGNAIGEPPTTKGYTPSVFSLLPRLLERTGPQSSGRGSISGIYTVLVDGDDFNDPIADAVRSILDGHINLSRDLAAKGHYPAIDLSSSASRVMNEIVTKEHLNMATKVKSMMGIYKENFDLVQIGAYQNGTNPALDEALDYMPSIERFLRQDIDEKSNLDQSTELLLKILNRDQTNIEQG